MRANKLVHRIDASPICISLSPLVQQEASIFGWNVLGPLLKLRLGLPLIPVNTEHNSHTISCFLLWQPDFMITFDLIDEGLQLFFDQFSRRFIGRCVAIARAARPIPTILYMNGLETGDDLVSCVILVDRS